MLIKEFFLNVTNNYDLKVVAEHSKSLGIEKLINQPNSLSLLFYDIFPIKSKILRDKIDFIADLIFLSVLTLDDVLDKHLSYWKETMLFSHIVNEKLIKELHHLLQDDEGFWVFYENCKQEYVKTSLEEQEKHLKVFNKYSLNDFERIARGKAAMAKIIPVLMAIVENKREYIPLLADSVDTYYIAVQVTDDVEDWKEDFQEKHFSYLLTQIIEEKNWSENRDKIDLSALGRVVFFGGYAEKHLSDSIEYLTRAKEIVNEIPCEDWKKKIDFDIAKCKKFQNYIEGVKNEEIKKLDLEKI